MKIRDLTKEPISTITNLAYPVGCWLGVGGLSLLSGFTVLAGIGMGVGSALFHGRRKRKFQALDEINMYTLLLAVTAYNIGSEIMIAGIIAAGMWLWYHHELVSSSLAVPALGVAAIVTTGLMGTWWSAAFALAVFLASFTLRQWAEAIRNAHLYRYSLKYDILHGLWHVGTGITIYILLVS